MTINFIIPAWKIPWTENLEGVSFWGHKRARYNLVTKQLEWVAIPFYRGSSEPGIKPRTPELQAEESLPSESSGKP